jgi:hypothetical protein
MSRIQPIDRNQASGDLKAAFERHITEYNARITNMKATLGHSRLAFEVYMQWYPLYQEVIKITGERLAYLFAYAVSLGSNCPLCTTFFRRIIIDNGERPEDLHLTEAEQRLLDFGSQIAENKGYIPDAVYDSVASLYTQEQIVVLVAFAGQMIATNVFNNVLEVEIDEYLTPYIPLTKPVSEHSHGN